MAVRVRVPFATLPALVSSQVAFSVFSPGNTQFLTNAVYALIDQLSEQEPVEMACKAFDLSCSSYYEHCRRRSVIAAERVVLRAGVNRMITTMLNNEGVLIGRFKVHRLMSELGLICKQPGSYAYKQATVERPDIPNRLNREFSVSRPDLAWYGDITYIWAGQKWSYLTVVPDLCARRSVGWALSDRPDAELVVKALDHAYEQRGKPIGVLFHSD